MRYREWAVQVRVFFDIPLDSSFEFICLNSQVILDSGIVLGGSSGGDVVQFVEVKRTQSFNRAMWRVFKKPSI